MAERLLSIVLLIALVTRLNLLDVTTGCNGEDFLEDLGKSFI